MAISESQLETWSHQGSKAQSATTYQTIKGALEDPSAPYSNRVFEVFLQGSYGNDTNIYAESDVDIVICLTETLNSDIGGLDDAEKARYEANRVAAAYGFDDFKAEVVAWLRTRYGGGIKVGKKAIQIPGNNSRRDADVIVCIQHRRYTSYLSGRNARFHSGICFWITDGTKIVNFPRQHQSNCTNKHQATGKQFKGNVRVLKNMRNAMVQDGFLPDGVAPSYFLEGMLWSVPDQNFVTRYQGTIENYLYWLEHCDPKRLSCANDLHWLVRDGVSICWNTADFNTLIETARRYWTIGLR